MLARTNSTVSGNIAAGTLPLSEAINLYDALSTVADLVSGFSCQPRFNSGERHYSCNAAGSELEDLAETIGGRMEELLDMVRASRPDDPFYQQRRMVFLLRHEVVNDDAIAEVAGAAARAVFQDKF